MNKVYLFVGKEDYLIDEEIKKLKSTGKEIEIFIDPVEEELNSAINTPSLFSSERIVVIIAKEIDKRTSFYKEISKIAEIKEFKSFTEWEQSQVVAWVVNKAKDFGKHIGVHAAEALIEIVGFGLRMLSSEIEKLVTYIGERNNIELEDILNLASSGDVNAFKLTAALGEKNVSSALNILTKLIRDGEDPIQLLGLLASQYRMLLQVKSLEEKKLNSFKIAERLKANHYFVKHSLERAKNYSLEQLKNALLFLHDADLKLKSGGGQEAILEILVSDLCA